MMKDAKNMEKMLKQIGKSSREKKRASWVALVPITGRTHQLRVHAAHKGGLNTPIVGDDLYGNKTNRLHLHAEFIEFLHPSTSEKMSFRVEAEF